MPNAGVIFFTHDLSIKYVLNQQSLSWSLPSIPLEIIVGMVFLNVISYIRDYRFQRL
jgi:hypothetical protein